MFSVETNHKKFYPLLLNALMKQSWPVKESVCEILVMILKEYACHPMRADIQDLMCKKLAPSKLSHERLIYLRFVEVACRQLSR